MELSFSDAKIRELCCSRSALVHTFGTEFAQKIACRLALLVAAPSLADVPMGLPVSLTPLPRQGNFSVALGAKHLLLLQAVPAEAASGTDFSHISKILIIGPVPVPAPKAKRP